MTTARGLFNTVPRQDYLHFYANDTFQPQSVAKFLDLNKADVAKVAGVALSSVRYDHKAPREVTQRFEEIANICGLIAEFFHGDVKKTALWFRTKNPMFGHVSPRDMIRYGRYGKVHRLVMDALEENGAAVVSSNEPLN
jgi:hypothetical protein